MRVAGTGLWGVFVLFTPFCCDLKVLYKIMCIFFKKQNTLEAVSWVRLRPQPRVLMPPFRPVEVNALVLPGRWRPRFIGLHCRTGVPSPRWI